MAKFSGVIGYAETVETAPGVWSEQITERKHFGDVIRNSRRLVTATNVNDDINIGNEFSIVADPFAKDNFHSMRYIVYMGTKWKVSNVDVQYPRLIITPGGIYNENET